MFQQHFLGASLRLDKEAASDSWQGVRSGEGKGLGALISGEGLPF